MNEAHKILIEEIITKGGFAATVAQTVLSTGNCSYDQFEILNDAASDFLDWNELNQVDVTNLKVDENFEAMKAKAFKNQSINL